MTVSTATQKTSGCISEPREGRLRLVYAAHQRLEDELSTLLAFATAARKHDENASQSRDGFSPWTGLMESAVKCVDATSRCLRLFNPTRTITQSKGMTTLAKLYGTGAAPHERVITFLMHIRDAFDGVLPVEIALSGGHCLQRLDPSAADEYLLAFVTDWLALAAAADEQADPFRRRFCDRLSTDNAQKTFHLHFRAAVLLQIECAAQSGRKHVFAAYNTQVMDAILTPFTREELQKYEATCWQEAARHREVESVVAVPFVSAAPASTVSSALAAYKQQGTQRGTSTEARRGGAVAPSSSGMANWRHDAIRILAFLLLAVLLRFAWGPLARALKSVLQVTRAAPARQRTLAL
ncbi:hypothetical protein conserved [Leishmania donovani]|uniref:Uncharacterized protein n=2 Tax=Leishmania donovani TaxID=5661 RepID=A0A504Y987_LEIDO|nr:hypothetical protein CGC20_22815 [Leishmania donovani]CAJ1988480.1 hypothetical protein conserved [Leishmania donovani]